MATTAPTWSRPHRASAGDYRLSGIYRHIVEEWTRMSELPHVPASLRKWAKARPVLKGTASLADLLDRIDEAGAEETDEILVALISLAQSGQRMAGQVVLQAMLPKLSKMAHTANMNGTDAGDIEDRRHIGVATFLEVLAVYPVQRRTRRVASNLALDTLHTLTADTRATATEYPVTMSAAGCDRGAAYELGGELFDQPAEPFTMADVDPSSDPTGEQVAASIGDFPNPDGSLLEVVAWGIDAGTISAEDAALLVRVYAPAIGEQGGHASVAAELGLRAETIRQRCSRATRALATAVRAQADGSWMDSPAFA